MIWAILGIILIGGIISSFYMGYCYSRKNICVYWLGNQKLVFPKDNPSYNLFSEELSDILKLINAEKYKEAQTRIYELLPSVQLRANERCHYASPFAQNKISNAIKLLDEINSSIKK